MEHPPLPPVIEALGPVSTLELQLGNVPPLRRSWLISKDGRSLLQIQEDRFLFNWKKAGPDDGYRVMMWSSRNSMNIWTASPPFWTKAKSVNQSIANSS